MLSIRYVSGVIAFILVFLILTLGCASASIEISVGSILDQVSPGQHVAYEINVTASNDSSAKDFAADIYGFGQSLDGSYVELKADQDKSPYSARAYLKLDSKDFRLEPG